MEGYTKGRVVLATVFGDVHDIGKNLVNTILSNNGYTVYDLGKQVPLNTIIDKAIEVNADVIGLSALLVSTSKQMPACVAELDRRHLPFPVMVGGAAINRAYGQRILYVGEPGQEQPYGPGVFYARDAFEGLEIVEALTDSEKHAPFVERVKREAQSARELQAERDAARAAAPAVVSDHAPVAPAPVIVAPFWGARVLDRVAVEDVASYLDMNALYRGRWGGVAHGDEYKRLVREEFEPRLERLLREARQRQYLRPRAIYGYYPARAEDDTLLVLDPSDHSRVLERFTFPRQADGQRLCLADYFATESGEPTAVAFQVVTMGNRASQETERMQAAGDYSEAYFLHGLSVQMAEAMADYVNRRVCDELKLTGEAGRRYSWGYAAIPELADHERVFRLMGVPEAIDVTLTDSYQLVPEQSTAAIVVPHPGSVYFAVREAASTNAG
jgi:5-methyltetrahydrofolate--homocysteine methyltransferase